MQILLIFSLLIAIIAVIFAVQNTTTITVNFLFWTFQSSLALVLLIALSVGALISILASTPSLLRDKWTIRSHRKKVVELESVLDDHKTKLDAAQKKLQEQELAQASDVKLPEDSPRQS
jgi:uncharacterized integral membrane protein